jgi:arylsulfatase
VPLLFGIAPFEGIDVGIDRRSPVSWDLYERFGPFPYSGTLHSVTYTPGEPAPDAPVHLMDMLREMGVKFE